MFSVLSKTFFLHVAVTGLAFTQFLILGTWPTLSHRLAILGKARRSCEQKIVDLRETASEIFTFGGFPPIPSDVNWNTAKSAQVRLFPTKYCPPRDTSIFSRLAWSGSLQRGKSQELICTYQSSGVDIVKNIWNTLLISAQGHFGHSSLEITDSIHNLISLSTLKISLAA